MFTRLLYYGTVQMHFSEEETWLMPLGQLLDLMACHRQFLGYEKPKHELDIDEIIPL